MSKRAGNPLLNINYLLILWMLSKAPAHGYEILLKFSDLFGRRVTSGALYPMLYKMERLGLIFSEVVRGTGNRTKRIYHIKESGLEAVADFASKFGDFFDFMVSAKESHYGQAVTVPI
jgi:PadR family transcriptional regulator PadR